MVGWLVGGCVGGLVAWVVSELVGWLLAVVWYNKILKFFLSML